MKKLIVVCVLILALFVPFTLALMQGGPSVEITGVNPTNLPTVVITANVLDSIGQPVGNLTAENFRITGELAGRADIVSVRRIQDENLPVSIVLALDVSSSMSETPIAAAREAARSFVNAIGPDDPVAIVTFANEVRVVQDFTSDKAALLAAIDALQVGGETALYSGALRAVEVAAEAPSPRRAVILLSDGAHYDTLNITPPVAREAAVEQARVRGVPVYTVGLGFGTDRTYLEQLADSTNARYIESPAPDQLTQAYGELAALLRSQYEIVLNADLPLDGTIYPLQIEVTTPEGTATDDAELRAPVPVPVVRLPELADPIIAEPTEIAPEIIADDGVARVEVLVDGVSQTVLTEEPYRFTIDPAQLAPGPHTLTFSVTDNDGDATSATLDFEAAALPSEVALTVTEPADPYTEPLVVALTITGQTEPTEVTYSVNGGAPVTLTAPYSFELNPANLPPGDLQLSISVTNAGGVSTTIEATPYVVPDLPPSVAIAGLESGQVISETVEVRVDAATTQAAVSDISFAVNGAALPATEPGVTLIDPVEIAPGPATLTITVTNELGQVTTQAVDFEVAALVPDVTISGVSLGETLEENRVIEASAGGQTAITSIIMRLNGDVVAETTGEPAQYEVDVVELGPAAYVLQVEVTNAGGQTTITELAFAIAEGPALTATALAPTATPTASDTPMPTNTPTPTFTATMAPSPTNTATPDLTITAEAQSASAQQTADAEVTGAAVVAASETAVAQAAIAATREADLTVTAVTEAETTAQAATAEIATVTDEAAITATADVIAQLTVQAQATADAVALTETAQAAAEVTLTGEAAVTATAVAQLQLTAEADAQTATAAAEATAVQLAAVATDDSASTATALAVQAQQTEAAALTATAVAEETLAAQAQQTEAAALTATAVAEEQLTAQAQQTEAAALTATAVAEETLTAQAQQTEAAALTATAIAEETLAAQAQQTEAAALTATDAAAATIAADALLTAEAADTATAQAVVPTDTDEPTVTLTDTTEPTATPTEEPTVVAQVAASDTPTLVPEDGSPEPTITPRGTLIPAQTTDQPAPGSDILPIVLVVAGLALILVLIFLMLSRARRNR